MLLFIFDYNKAKDNIIKIVNQFCTLSLNVSNTKEFQSAEQFQNAL